MTQVSKYPLKKEIEHELFSLFWNSISDLRSKPAVSEFFSDLLTDTEEIMLAKRFAVALLLFKGKKPIDIAMSIHVSYSMIRGVSSWLDRATPNTIALLERVVKRQTWQSITDSLDEGLDILPPRYGSNWRQAGKEKWKRKVERNAHAIFQ